mmetsp:Transcript_9794/g.30400  ORF Transcript_9794/g.30400 Transcript_9794/m.30400 type:complete len:201 (-) Transcript_9794:131-733(-)
MQMFSDKSKTAAQLLDSRIPLRLQSLRVVGSAVASADVAPGQLTIEHVHNEVADRHQVVLSAELHTLMCLRTGVLRRAHEAHALRQLNMLASLRVDKLVGQAKVDNEHLVILRAQAQAEVFQLHVSVDNAPERAMQCPKHSEHFRDGIITSAPPKKTLNQQKPKFTRCSTVQEPSNKLLPCGLWGIWSIVFKCEKTQGSE